MMHVQRVDKCSYSEEDFYVHFECTDWVSTVLTVSRRDLQEELWSHIPQLEVF